MFQGVSGLSIRFHGNLRSFSDASKRFSCLQRGFGGLNKLSGEMRGAFEWFQGVYKALQGVQ